MSSTDSNSGTPTNWHDRTFITDVDHNPRGLEDYRVEALGLPEERHIDTEWHPSFRLPVSITESRPDGTGALITERVTTFSYDPVTGQRLSRTITDHTGLTNDSRTWAVDLYGWELRRACEPAGDRGRPAHGRERCHRLCLLLKRRTAKFGDTHQMATKLWGTQISGA